MFRIYCKLNLHVSASIRDVIRACRKVMSKNDKSRDKRAARRSFYNQMFEQHNNAQKLYHFVQTGG